MRGCNSSSQQYNGSSQEVNRQAFRSCRSKLGKAETGTLLAQLLGEADDLAGKFAKEADERYVAGSTCERTYDKVIGLHDE